MKSLITSVVALCMGITVFSQNNGQNSENGSLRISYMGYSSGNYVIDIYNKEAVPLDVQMDWLGSDTTFYAISASTIRTVQLPGDAINHTKLKAKVLTNVSNPDHGWVEVYSPQNLGAVGWDETFRVWTEGNYIKFSWTTYTEDKCGFFRIDKSEDGKTNWTTYAMIDSKAPGGSSSMPISYLYSSPKGGNKMRQAGFSIILVGMFLLLLISRRFVPVAACGIFFCSIACTRSKIFDEGSSGTAYFRITQVDNNNSTYTTGPTKQVKL